MSETFDTNKFFFIANNLSLDFVNTKIVSNGEPLDLLISFNDLLAWMIGGGLLSEPEAKSLLAKWSDNSKVQVLLKQAVALRQNLFASIRNIVGGGTVHQSTINEINILLQNKSGFFELKKKDEGFEKYYHFNFEKLENLLVPIAESAADLLCYGDLSLLKKCESKDCVLYFYDTSKNHKRRWCSMSACGNRAKAAAFYQRQKGMQ